MDDRVPVLQVGEIVRLDDDDLEKKLHYARVVANSQVPEAVAWFEALVREDEKRKQS